MNITPRNSQTIDGSQPQMLAAVMAPTIGPAAAMDLKWYPYSTLRLAGTKSTPSMYRVAGVALRASDWMTLWSMRRAYRLYPTKITMPPRIIAISVTAHHLLQAPRALSAPASGPRRARCPCLAVPPPYLDRRQG